MNGSKISLCCVIWFLFFYFIGFGNSSLHAKKVNNGRWSFAFKNCTISDALRQMTRVTGIDISTNQSRDKGLFSKSFKDQTIDEILKDFFRKENCAIVWYYSPKGIDAIKIWIFEGSGSGGSFGLEKFPKQRGTSLKSNRIRKNAGYKSMVVKRQSQGTEKNDSLSHQGESRDYTKDAKESIGSQYGKMSTGGGQSKSANLGHTILGGDKSEATPAPPSPMPEVADPGPNNPDDGVAQEEDQTIGIVPPPPTPAEIGGLEPPPMPPGFSH